jgi:hypothetical protein
MIGMQTTLEVIAGDPDEMSKAATDKIAKVATKTVREAAELMKHGAREAIASGGFSSRWQNARCELISTRRAACRVSRPRSGATLARIPNKLAPNRNT